MNRERGLFQDVAAVVGGTLVNLPVMDRRELSRAMVVFGQSALSLSLFVGALAGAIVIVQTSLYISRFGAREFLGWAAGYALIHEIGPLLLGLVLSARFGARNAAELATLEVGGQVEGLRGIGVDTMAVLVAPRVVAITACLGLLSGAVFSVGILAELLAAYFTLDLPIRVFLGSLAGLVGLGDVVAGVTKCLCFGAAIAVISTATGLRASGGARAVGNAAASAVVVSCGSVFALDLALTLLFIGGVR